MTQKRKSVYSRLMDDEEEKLRYFTWYTVAIVVAYLIGFGLFSWIGERTV